MVDRSVSHVHHGAMKSAVSTEETLLRSPCVGLEGEDSAVRLRTMQKPVLELRARSLCNPDYPLLQITGDMGAGAWRTLELITGPVPASAALLKDIHLLYQATFDLLFEQPKDDKVALVVKKVEGEEKEDEEEEEDEKEEGRVAPGFKARREKLLPGLVKSFTEDGLGRLLRSGDAKQHMASLRWRMSRTATGRARTPKDYPVLVHGPWRISGVRLRDFQIGLQATFEVPLECGKVWETSMRPLYLGRHWPDFHERLSGTIHELAVTIGNALQIAQPG